LAIKVWRGGGNKPELSIAEDVARREKKWPIGHEEETAEQGEKTVSAEMKVMHPPQIG